MEAREVDNRIRNVVRQMMPTPAAPDSVDWRNVGSFTNGWLNLGGGWTSAGYRKDGNWVTLRGLIKSGTVGTVAFTLPIGFRPDVIYTFSTLTSGGGGSRIDIAKDGTVLLQTPSSNTFTSLDGIRFYSP